MAISALRRLCIPFLVVAVTIALLALSSGGSSKAQWIPNTPQFQPVFEFRLCNDLPSTFTGPAVLQGPVRPAHCTPTTGTAGSVRDITTDFTVPAGHMAYDQASFLTVGGASETRLPGPVGGGPNGDGSGHPAGGLISFITLGLANNPCNSSVQPDFIWWDSETSMATADEVACQPEGTDDRWSNMAFDGTGGDLFPGQADPSSPIVTDFPICLKKVFDPDGSGGGPSSVPPDGSAYDPVQPHWRGAGLTQVPPGGGWQMLNNIEFAPGDLKAAFLANPDTTNHPYSKLDASLGYVNLILLNDVTTAILEPNPISDFCSSLGTQGMIKGQVGAVNRITQPVTPGSYVTQARTMSYRDADGDGLENNFDTCAWTANTDDPYNTAGVDIDMLDPACDPDPNNPAAQFDEDGDTYSNSQDWCPQVSNPPVPGVSGEEDSESDRTLTSYNAANPDGGPPQDSIGDDCDGTVSGENPGGLGNSTMSNGLFFNAIHVDSVTITGSVVDGDNDGWGDDIDPDDADANNPGQMTHSKIDITATYDPTNDEDTAGADTCGDTIDNGPDGFTDISDPDCHDQVFGWDSDGDAYSFMLEWTFIGTDPGYACPVFPGGHDAWPSDMDNDGTANLLDLLPFKVAFNAQQGDANYNSRVDLNPVGTGTIYKVNLLDLLPFKAHFNVECTAIP